MVVAAAAQSRYSGIGGSGSRSRSFSELMLPQQVYPLCFVWKTDFWSTLGNLLRDAVPEYRPDACQGDDPYPADLKPD